MILPDTARVRFGGPEQEIMCAGLRPGESLCLWLSYGKTAERIIKDILKHQDMKAADLAAWSGREPGTVELRRRVDVGRGLVVAIVSNGPDGQAFGAAIRELEWQEQQL